MEAEINIKSDNNIIQLKEAKDIAAKISVVGTQNYRMERSFDVLDKAAANGSGIMGSSLELGAGLAVGTQMGYMTAEHFSTNPQSIPPIPVSAYYLAINGTQQGPYNIEQIKQMISARTVTANTFVWKEGMPQWDALSSLAEFANSFRQVPPPLPIP